MSFETPERPLRPDRLCSGSPTSAALIPRCSMVQHHPRVELARPRAIGEPSSAVNPIVLDTFPLAQPAHRGAAAEMCDDTRPPARSGATVRSCSATYS